MTFDDIDAVIEIERLSFPTPWPRDAFIYELARPHRSLCRVAEFFPYKGAPVIVGDIVIWLAGSIAHIATLAVHPAFRRKGVGQCLLVNGLLECVVRGLTEALLEVREKNFAAQRLYHKLGFEVVGIRKNYYQDTGEDAIVMTHDPLVSDKLAEFANCG